MIDLKDRRITLIGGAGFIGHHIALDLKSRGADVSILDSLQINNLLAFATENGAHANRDLYQKMIHERLNLLNEARIPLYVQDARDYHQISKLLTQINPQVVVLLAAVSHAGRSNKDPYSTFDHSLRTLENALDWSRGSKIEQFIYFSSSMVYGNFNDAVVTEESVCEPLGIYGALKISGERIVKAYNQVFKLPYTIVRPSALYGERCVSRRVGQIFIENVLQGMDIVVKGDGLEKLDFTYIDDLVQGIRKCIENENALNQTFNITYGNARSLNEMAAVLQDHFPHITIQLEERDALVPKRGTLSIDKARDLIGYDPQFPIEKGYVKYMEWYKSFFRNYTYSTKIAQSIEKADRETLATYSGLSRPSAFSQPQVYE